MKRRLIFDILGYVILLEIFFGGWFLIKRQQRKTRLEEFFKNVRVIKNEN